MNRPLISVIMSIYNEEEEWMKQAIDSILSQSYSYFEFIIINDNPERLLNRQLLESYKDDRLIVLVNDENIGLTRSLNKGLALASGKYIARMDADDIAYPERFSIQLEYMELNPDCVVCGSKIDEFGLNCRKFTGIFESDTDNKLQLFLGPCFAHPSVMIRREKLIEHDIKYDEKCRFAQDYMLWIDLCDFGDFHNIQKPLLKYRFSDTQISSSRLDEQSKLAMMIRKKMIRKFITSLNSEFIFPETLTADILNKLKIIENSNDSKEPMVFMAFSKVYFIVMSSLHKKDLFFVIYFAMKNKFSIKDIIKITRNIFLKRGFL